MEEMYNSVVSIINRNIKETYKNKMFGKEKFQFSEISNAEIEEDLTNYGMDSITFIQIIIDLEEEFDVEIPDEYLLLSQLDTVKKMVDTIQYVLNK